MAVYIPINETYAKLDMSDVKNTSINGIAEHLGYDPCQVYTPMTCSETGLLCVTFKLFSKEVVFAFTDDNIPESEAVQRIKKYTNNINLSSEYKSFYLLEDNIKEGIEKEIFTVDFMSSALGQKIEPNSNIVSTEFNYEFVFENGILIDFMDADGLSSELRLWREMAPFIYERHKALAENYFEASSGKIQKYLNLQAKAFISIPVEQLEILKNSYDGIVNYAAFNLLYNEDKSTNLSIEDWKDITLGEIEKSIFF